MAAATAEVKETAEQALERIQNGFSQNDLLCVYYFHACGVPAGAIEPRENVLTFKAWKAKGRSVAKGAKGCPVTVWIAGKKKDENGEPIKFPRTTRLFHESQTVPAGSKDATPEAAGNEFLIDPERTNDEQRKAMHEAAAAEAKAAKESSEGEEAGAEEAAEQEEQTAEAITAETVTAEPVAAFPSPDEPAPSLWGGEVAGTLF